MDAPCIRVLDPTVAAEIDDLEKRIDKFFRFHPQSTREIAVVHHQKPQRPRGEGYDTVQPSKRPQHELGDNSAAVIGPPNSNTYLCGKRCSCCCAARG